MMSRYRTIAPVASGNFGLLGCFHDLHLVIVLSVSKGDFADSGIERLNALN